MGRVKDHVRNKLIAGVLAAIPVAVMMFIPPATRILALLAGPA